ncbi:MAG: 4Fe-4S binding protein [Candidatus Helarchaeota archaeon]|nr:4Fe-4S binding protein [Candidatus Helarchaeota archaeon]
MKKLILNFDAGLVNEAITANIILENQVIINILRANVSEQGGIFLIEVPDERCELVRTAFEEAGVKVEHGKIIEKLEDKCTHCGACFSICPVTAIELTDEFLVQFDYEKCIGCLNCIDACPVDAIILQR